MTRGGSPYVEGGVGCIMLIGLGVFALLALAAVGVTGMMLSGGNLVGAAITGLISVVLLWFVFGGHIDDYRVRQQQKREDDARKRGSGGD